jgi:hypothetical protein
VPLAHPVAGPQLPCSMGRVLVLVLVLAQQIVDIRWVCVREIRTQTERPLCRLPDALPRGPFAFSSTGLAA